jgi:putative intracellular protease/amidase
MKILIPLPDRDFDTTEVAVPWKLAVRAGHEVVFATEKGSAGPVPACDPLLLTGVVFGKLGAAPEAKQFYEELIATDAYRSPIAWESIAPERFDGLILPGGHAPGMRQYLEDETLRGKIAAFWQSGRPVGAICHGVLALARAGVMTDTRTTCLPRYMERNAYLISFWRRGRYYRTYETYVEDEVRAALRDPGTQFVRGPKTTLARGTDSDDAPAFVVEDGRYVSARWPGDAYLFGKTFLKRL